jgi:hypothetical protein
VTGDRDVNLITDGRNGWVSQAAAISRRWGGRVGPPTCGEYLQQLCLTPPGREGVDLYLSAGWQICGGRCQLPWGHSAGGPGPGAESIVRVVPDAAEVLIDGHQARHDPPRAP